MNLEKLIIEIKNQLLPEENLLKRAADFNGLVLQGEIPHLASQSIGCYKLTDSKFVKALEQKGFKLTKRPDGVITLSDENPQVEIQGYAPSNYWNFRNDDEKKDPLHLTLHLAPVLKQSRRGIIFFPEARGTFLSPADRLPNSRIFKVVAEFDPKTHPLVKAVADKDELLVSWTNTELGGIRTLRSLFDEFRNTKEKLSDLAYSSTSPFDPIPYPSSNEETYYAPENIQPLIFDVWQAQLDEFREQL